MNTKNFVTEPLLKGLFNLNFISSEINNDERLVLCELVIGINKENIYFTLVNIDDKLTTLTLINKLSKSPFNIELSLISRAGSILNMFILEDCYVSVDYGQFLDLDYSSNDLLIECKIEVNYKKSNIKYIL
jgi:hypothetical protein